MSLSAAAGTPVMVITNDSSPSQIDGLHRMESLLRHKRAAGRIEPLTFSSRFYVLHSLTQPPPAWMIDRS